MSAIERAINHVGELSHVVINGDHGVFNVTILWGGSGPFRGIGPDLATAYRAALDSIIVTGHSTPGLHELAAQITPGVFD